MGKFRFGQSILKLSENLEQALCYEAYFEESNINRKPLILLQDMIITKFEQKKWPSSVLGRVYENYQKI